MFHYLIYPHSQKKKGPWEKKGNISTTSYKLVANNAENRSKSKIVTLSFKIWLCLVTSFITTWTFIKTSGSSRELMLRRTCTQTDRRNFFFQTQTFPSFLLERTEPFLLAPPTQPESSAGSPTKKTQKSAVEVTLPAIPWVCRMKFFQLSPAPCAEGRSAAAAPWSCALSPSPLHCTSSFQPNMSMPLSSAEAFCSAFIHTLRRGVEPTEPLALALCRANKSWHPADHHWQPCMRWDAASEESGPFIVYLFHSHAGSWWGPVRACILDSSPSVTCSGSELVHEINSSVFLYLVMSFSFLSIQYFIHYCPSMTFLEFRPRFTF